MEFTRYEGNPILRPKPENQWESRCVYNPGVIYHQGLFHMIYRAMGNDRISRLGYAVSTDGFNFFRFDKPVFTPKVILEPRGCEDPRLVLLDNKIYMTYTAYSERGTRIGIAYTENFLNWTRIDVQWPEENNKDAVLFPEKLGGKYVMFHRPTIGDEGKTMDIWVAYSNDLTEWYGREPVMSPRGTDTWEGGKVGSGPPPVLTEKGWLLIYHAVDDKGVYRLGAALFDRDDPSRFMQRYEEPVLEPKADYEVLGEIPRVVFGSGICEVSGKYYMYYGGADKVIGVAVVEKQVLLDIFK